MLRCACCGSWTVEVVQLDRGAGRGGLSVFYRVRHNGQIFDEYLTLDAMERELAERGVYEHLTEVDDELPRAA